MNADCLLFDELDSPVGKLVLSAHGGNLCSLEFAEYGTSHLNSLARRFDEVRKHANPFGFSSAVQAYLNGDMQALDDIPVSLVGTDFQKTVWLTLREIAVGTTWSYGELAARIGQPKSSRAVGLANGSNPISIVLPCHRVIGANGKLTGYGGGLPRKEWLLKHEGALGRQLMLV